MNKSSREKVNLLIASFLVIGFVVCSYFFMTLISTLNMPFAKANFLKAAVFVVFGLLVFYATRIGEGVPVKRFSPIVLCVIDLPALYIILASLITKLPLHNQLVTVPEIMMFAGVAFGYGIMYTFYSGFEFKEEEEVKFEVAKTQDEEELLEGGLLEELSSLEEETVTEEDVKELESLDGVEAE